MLPVAVLVQFSNNAVPSKGKVSRYDQRRDDVALCESLSVYYSYKRLIPESNQVLVVSTSYRCTHCGRCRVI